MIALILAGAVIVGCMYPVARNMDKADRLKGESK